MMFYEEFIWDVVLLFLPCVTKADSYIFHVLMQCSTWLRNIICKHVLQKHPISYDVITKQSIWSKAMFPFVRILTMYPKTSKFTLFPNVSSLLHCERVFANIWPMNLTSLTFSHLFNKEIEPYCLPQNLQHLTFGNLFNQPLKLNTIPKTVQSLTFGFCFNQPMLEYDGVLPQVLTTLQFGHRFNQKLCLLPAILTKLTFGHDFDHTFRLDNLLQLTSLEFGHAFNQTVPFLSPTLTYLQFGLCFELTNLPLPILPHTLRQLVLTISTVDAGLHQKALLLSFTSSCNCQILHLFELDHNS